MLSVLFVLYALNDLIVCKLRRVNLSVAIFFSIFIFTVFLLFFCSPGSCFVALAASVAFASCLALWLLRPGWLLWLLQLVRRLRLLCLRLRLFGFWLSILT